MCSLIIHHYNPWSIIWNLEVGLLWLYRGISFLVEETGGPGENHRQTLLHNVVHLALIEIRTYNISGDKH